MKMRFLTTILAFGAIFAAQNISAALITHTDYTAGNVITASGQNTNENAVFNEFNGNIESANIKDGTIANADIANNTIDVGKFTTTVQSTFTYFNQLHT